MSLLKAAVLLWLKLKDKLFQNRPIGTVILNNSFKVITFYKMHPNNTF